MWVKNTSLHIHVSPKPLSRTLELTPQTICAVDFLYGHACWVARHGSTLDTESAAIIT